MLELESRWYQQQAVDELFNYFLVKQGNPVVGLPTGTGKSVVIANFVKRALMSYPSTRVAVVTHSKDLIGQNAKKMQQAWPHAPIGVYSAGLKQREFMQPIIFGGVQSLAKAPTILGHRDLLLVDEAHLVSDEDESNYQVLLKALRQINPYIKVIGFTATFWRTAQGSITDGSIFTDMVFNLCTMEGFNRLIAEGYLSTLIARPTDTQLDVSDVDMSAGDYNQKQLQAKVDTNDKIYAALNEAMSYSAHRNCWMAFAAGTDHADHIADMLTNHFGVPSVSIHSKLEITERDRRFEAWKEGAAVCAVSMNQLTTGVDHAPIDFIIDLGPTMSSLKHVQKLGRGTRPYDWRNPNQYIKGYEYTKENCLVLDYAGNVPRNGPINDPVIPKTRKKGFASEAPIKICPKDKTDPNGRKGCGNYCSTAQRSCHICGFEFPYNSNLNIDTHAGNHQIIKSDLPVVENFKVERVMYTPHTWKHTGKSDVQVTYYCSGYRTFYEYVDLEATQSYPRHMARDWFRERYPGEPPLTNTELLNLTTEYQFKEPVEIMVWLNTKYPKVKGYVW